LKRKGTILDLSKELGKDAGFPRGPKENGGEKAAAVLSN